MSNIWGIRYRLFQERLTELADQLSSATPQAPAVTEDQLVRLLATVAMLAHQHHVNNRGQCRFCGWTRWAWRCWRRRRRCTVYHALDFALTQETDVVWWQLLTSVGREVSLAAIREWLAPQPPCPPPDSPTEDHRK